VTDQSSKARATSRRRGSKKQRTGRTTCPCRSTCLSSAKRTFHCSRRRQRRWRVSFRKRGRWPLTSRRGCVSPFVFYLAHKSPGFEVLKEL